MKSRLIGASHDRQKLTHGFTLIEVLCALALAGLLLSAVAGAIHMQWKFRNSGESRIEHAQVLQGFVDDFARDVRSVTAIRTQTDSHLKDPVKSFVGIGFVPLTEIREQFLRLNPHTQREFVEFFGTEDFVLMRPRDSNSQGEMNSHGSVNQALKTVQQVVWLNPASRDLRVPFLRENKSLRYQSINVASIATGVQRIAVSPHEVQSEVTAATFDLAKHNAQVIAPEMQSVRFRYFDGHQWQPAWDSEIQLRLPQAIELTVVSTFDPAARTIVVRLPQSG